jgi:hypothetical protein
LYGPTFWVAHAPVAECVRGRRWYCEPVAVRLRARRFHQRSRAGSPRCTLTLCDFPCVYRGSGSSDRVEIMVPGSPSDRAPLVVETFEGQHVEDGDRFDYPLFLRSSLPRRTDASPSLAASRISSGLGREPSGVPARRDWSRGANPRGLTRTGHRFLLDLSRNLRWASKTERLIANRRGGVDAPPLAVRTRRTRSGAPAKFPGKRPPKWVFFA